MNLQYADKHGLTLVKMLETELSGIAKDAALFMIGMKIKPYEEVAKLIEKSVSFLLCLYIGYTAERTPSLYSATHTFCIFVCSARALVRYKLSRMLTSPLVPLEIISPSDHCLPLPLCLFHFAHSVSLHLCCGRNGRAFAEVREHYALSEARKLDVVLWYIHSHLVLMDLLFA